MEHATTCSINILKSFNDKHVRNYLQLEIAVYFQVKN